MSIDLAQAIRRCKPEKRVTQASHRPDSELTDVASLAGKSRPFLLADTNVYINNAAGLLSGEAADLLDRTVLFHCSVCLGEIAVGIGNLDPAHKDWKKRRDAYATVFRSVPASRLLIPDAQIHADAGVAAGILARTQGFQPHQRKEMLNDALILLTATKAGLAVLTCDKGDYDLLQQICPEARFVHYRVMDRPEVLGPKAVRQVTLPSPTKPA